MSQGGSFSLKELDRALTESDSDLKAVDVLNIFSMLLYFAMCGRGCYVSRKRARACRAADQLDVKMIDDLEHGCKSGAQ